MSKVSFLPLTLDLVLWTSTVNKAMLIRLFLDRVMGNVSIFETWVCVCVWEHNVGVQAEGVLSKESIGVKINNERLKCQKIDWRWKRRQDRWVYRCVCVCGQWGLVLPVLVPRVIITLCNTFSDMFLSTDTWLAWHIRKSPLEDDF